MLDPDDGYQYVSQLTHIGFASLDAEGRFLQANVAYLTMLARQWEDLAGLHWRLTIHPDDHARAEEAFQAARRNGHGYEEIRGLKGDGNVLYEALTISQRSENGRFAGYNVIQYDISRYKSQQELFTHVVDSAPNGLLILNSTGEIQMCNAAVETLFGYKRKDLLGKPVEILLPERFRAKHRQDRRDFREADRKSMPARDVIGLRKDGKEIPVQVHLNTMETPGGSLILTTITDITERVRYEQQLEQARHAAEAANRAKSDFLARMSHEIRTPMNLIMGMNAMLLKSELSAKQRQFVEVSYRNVRRLLRLINGILDLSKVEAGKFTLETAPFDLRAVLQECAATISVAVEQKGLQFELQEAPGVWPFWIGDAERLQQVLLNLIGNSVKFTASGSIRVSVLPVAGPERREGVEFRVSDTGCGVSPEKSGSIFESFEQADTGMNRNYEGTGLGLAISRELVRLMGGELKLVPQEGPGSTFAFTAFFEKTSSDSMAARAAEADVSRAAQRIKLGANILVVEDNPENLLLVRSYLEGLTLNVAVAVNGQEAVERRKQSAYDLILMDIQMPIMDGHTATRQIRAYEKERGQAPVPIVALTAHALRGSDEESLRAGCDAHLSKPIERDQLVNTISRYAGTPSAAVAHDISAEIAAMRPRFLENRRLDVKKLEECLAAGDLDAARVIGHNCKGVGKSYGFPDIGAAGAAVEAAARAGDVTELRKAIANFTEVVEGACCAGV